MPQFLKTWSPGSSQHVLSGLFPFPTPSAADKNGPAVNHGYVWAERCRGRQHGHVEMTASGITLRSLLHRWLILVCVHLSNEGAVCCLARPFVRNRQGDVWKVHSISARLHSRYSLLFSCLVTSSSLWPHGLQHAGLLIAYHLLEFAQTQVHWVDDAIQPSHPLTPSSLSALDISHHQGLFQWVCSHQMTKILELQH